LRRRIKDAGLEDVYEIVPVGIEDLSEKWVEKEGVDCVVTVSTLSVLFTRINDDMGALLRPTDPMSLLSSPSQEHDLRSLQLHQTGWEMVRLRACRHSPRWPRRFVSM